MKKRLVIFTIGLLAFLACALVGYRQARTRLLEPDLEGFPRLRISGDMLPSGLHSSSNSNATVDAKADTNEGRLAAIREALDGRDFKRTEALLSDLAKQDPHAALESVKSLPEWAQFRATEVILHEWFKHEPDAAWNYIAEHQPGFFLTNEFVDSLKASGRFDLGVQAINRLPRLAERRQTAEMMFQAWAAYDPSSFSRWAQTLPSEIRGMALAEVAARNLLSGPVDQNSLNDTLGRNSSDLPAWRTLAQRLVSEGGYARAKEVFNQVAPPSGRSSGAYGYLAASGPPEDAAEWLAKLTDPTAHTSGTIRAVIAFERSNPDIAAQLSLDSGNLILTDRQLQRIIPYWAVKDPAAAMHFVQTATSISPDTRAKLVATISPLLPPHP